ncbi:MAG: undecaprenyl-diphosphate phosphatase [Pseudomonadota bacterium]
MTLTQLVVLAIVQGLTEFLPISSSGHLALLPRLFGWPDQGLAFDVAVHFGTLAGVVGYFRRDLVRIAAAMLAARRRVAASPDAKLGWMIGLATVPVAIAGVLGHDAIETHLRSPAVIAAATAGFGALLWLADALGRKTRGVDELGWSGALLIGLSQVLALIPGTSRSGITMTAGLLLGQTRQSAARFSFLTSIPVIVAAAGLETVNLLQADTRVAAADMLLAGALAAVVAYLTVGFFLRFVQRIGMAPFAVYRLLLAAVIWYALV